MPKKGSFIYQRTSGQWGEGYSPTYKAESHTRHDQAYGRASREAPDKFHVHLTVSPSPPELPRTPGFQETALEWLEQKRLRVKPATFVKYHNLLHRHLLPAFGNRSLASLNRTDVLNFTQMLLDRGRLDRRGGLSEKTVKDILLVLRSILEYGRCGENAPPAIQITYPREQAKDMRTLTDSERLLLETYLTTDTDVQKLGVLLCLYTGLRIGEVCALRWSDISLTEKSLRVERTVQRLQYLAQDGGDSEKTRLLVDTPKSRHSRREIPLPEWLVGRIRPLYPADSNRFLLSGHPTRCTDPRTYQNRFKKFMREAGLPDVSFHTLRHTVATLCVTLGFELKSLSEILGHANVNITLNRYVHSSMDMKRKNMGRLSVQPSARRNG